MKFTKYLQDKFLTIIIFLSTYVIILLMLFAFKIDISLILALSFIIIFSFISSFLLEFFRRKQFYDQLAINIDRLDKKYLVIETLKKPSFYDGELLYQSLYEINKSMIENVKNYEYSINDFKEYIEMWIHEVKIPISSLLLIAHNHKNQLDLKTINQIKRLDDYVEQVLYYVRSENAEKDYLITECKLDKIISNIALKNKNDLLENKIELVVENVNVNVLTDSKWLEFIINQIINNSIKYKKEKNSIIKISTSMLDENLVLTIYDNGIGIPSTDISKVFEKCFTGYNGHIKSKSTGMGLYIAKKLCTKLGHKITINSCEKEYTEVSITFPKNNYYDVLK